MEVLEVDPVVGLVAGAILSAFVAVTFCYLYAKLRTQGTQTST